MNFKISTFLSLIRALFPRWSFFDQTGFHYEVHYCVPEHKTWNKLEFEHQQKLYHVFLNSTFNLMLAEFNIIEHFARDIQELDIKDIENSNKSSIKLFLALIKEKIKDVTKVPKRIQIKLLARNGTEIVTVYHSQWVSLEMV